MSGPGGRASASSWPRSRTTRPGNSPRPSPASSTPRRVPASPRPPRGTRSSSSRCSLSPRRTARASQFRPRFKRSSPPASTGWRATSGPSEEDAARSELELTLARALDPLGDWARALGLYDAVIERARARGDRGLEWTAIVDRNFAEAILAPEAGSNAGYLSEAERAAGFFGEVGDEQRLARAWHSIAVFSSWSGSWAKGADAAERAAEFARRAGDRHQQRLSLSWLVLALVSGPMPAHEALRRLEEIFLLLGDDLDYHSTMFRGMSELQAMLGNVEAARTLHDRAVTLAEELGLKRRIAVTDLPFHPLSEALGTEETERKLRRALARLEEMGDRGILSTVAARLAGILYAQGRFEEAERVRRR